MSEQVIICPHCKKEIPLSEALSHEAREKMRLELQKELTDKERSLQQKEKELDDKVKALEEKARESVAVEMEDLKQQVKEKSEELQKAQKTELELRKRQRDVEEKEKNLELEIARKLDASQKEFKEKLGQEHNLELRQKEKVIEDLKNQLAEAQKRAEQGSQQLQGEVLELDLEETLRQAFPEDEIKRVPKGTRGADLLQKVCSPSGLHCGTIIWEAKRTKAWHGTWLDKLKDDQRRQKAELAVIASEVLPGEVQRFGVLEDVWVCDYASVGPVAMVLRRMLIQIASEKRARTMGSTFPGCDTLIDYTMEAGARETPAPTPTIARWALVLQAHGLVAPDAGHDDVDGAVRAFYGQRLPAGNEDCALYGFGYANGERYAEQGG